MLYPKISILIQPLKLLLSIFRNTFSIAIITLTIIYFIFKKKKIIFFYHPRKLQTFIHTLYIEDLLQNICENCVTIYGHETNKIMGKKYFFIKQSFIKFIFNVDLFISNNICDIFPPRSKKYEQSMQVLRKEIEYLGKAKQKVREEFNLIS